MFNAAELVTQNEVDLIAVLLVQVVVIVQDFTLEGNTNAVLVDYVPGLLVSS